MAVPITMACQAAPPEHTVGACSQVIHACQEAEHVTVIGVAKAAMQGLQQTAS